MLIAVAMIVSAIAEPDKIGQIRGDALASLFYFANWHFIFDSTSYFEQFGRPSLFTHLWSLSVEEQFYLFWPLVFAAGMKFFGRGRLLLGVLAGAIGSVVLAWILFDPGHDASRIYYGTDTHAVGLLAGVALALVWSPTQLRAHKSFGPLVGPILDAVGVIALGYLILSFVHVHDYDLALWHGGYLWIALATALLLAALAHPAARLGGIIGRPALLWLGLRTYSFYLWHWPVLAMTRPGVDVDLPRGILIPLQLIACLALADLSYRFVELPFSGKAKLPRMPEHWLRFARPALLVAVLGVILIVGWSGIVSAGNSNPESAAASTATVAKVHAKLPPAESEPASGKHRGQGATEGQGGAAEGKGAGEEVGQAAEKQLRAAKHWPRIVMLGDSVMIGAEENLAARLGPGFSMDAKVGRQATNSSRSRKIKHRPPSGGDGHPVGQQRPALLRRHGGAAQGDHQRRPALPDLRPRPGLLAGRVQRSDRRSLRSSGTTPPKSPGPKRPKKAAKTSRDRSTYYPRRLRRMNSSPSSRRSSARATTRRRW